MEKLNNEEEKYKAIKQNKYQAGKKAANSVGYNPLNFQFDDSDKGKSLQDAEDRNRLRQIARAQNMDMCGDSSYNLINGAESTPKLALVKAGRG